MENKKINISLDVLKEWIGESLIEKAYQAKDHYREQVDKGVLEFERTWSCCKLIAKKGEVELHIKVPTDLPEEE